MNYGAETQTREINLDGMPFLVERLQWGEDDVEYIVYEPRILRYNNPLSCGHSSHYISSDGRKWGEMTSYFPELVFEQYRPMSANRLIAVQSYLYARIRLAREIAAMAFEVHPQGIHLSGHFVYAG